MKNMRRALGLLLCAALVGGLIPPEAVRAAAPVQIHLGTEAGTAGLSAAAGVNAALTLGAPSAAPMLAPSAAFSAGPAAFAAPAAAAMPSALAPVSAAPAPALLAAPVAAAAEGPSNDAPKTPKAAAPAAARSWLSRAAGIFSRRSAPDSAAKDQSPTEAKARADMLFDAAAKPADSAEPVAAPANPTIGYRLGRWGATKIQSYKDKRAVAHDAFGGPKAEPMTFWGRVGYGAKWGLNLVGISALMDFTVAPLLSHFAWPLLLSPASMAGFGRVELLTKFGPSQIGAALTHAPIPFLGFALPLSTAMEEFTYRFIGFGVVFGLLALVKPVTALIAKGLEQIPDASGLRSKVQSLLINGGGLISYFAFPIAALRSSFNFAVAHFAHWGVDPYVFAINMVAGYFLARAAYKTRGLTAPFVAHMVFNLAMMGSLIFGAALGWPMAASVYAVLSSVVGVGALWYNWRSARKDRAFQLKSLAGGAKALLVAGLVSAAMLGGLNSGGTHAGMSLTNFSPAPMAQIAVKDAKTAAPADTAAVVEAPDTAAAASAAAPTVESQQDMIARVKPSVVKIIVKMDGGYALGSGTIVTPDGRIVTNAHVVGTKVAGEMVMVELIDGHKIPAKILAVNHDRDQAYLQLPRIVSKKTGEMIAWPISKFATTAPREGDEVFAMGHPLGLPFTVTKGIVSGLGSRANMYVQYLQTDASITHGNSGGPLYNARGEIVGMNTMGPENAGSIGFSITAPSIVRGLIQYDAVGNINTAAMGIITDLSNPDQPDQGVAVEFVRPGSAAAKAGIQAGDVIVGAAGEMIQAQGGRKSVHDLSAILAQAKPGDTIAVAVLHGDAVKVVKITLDGKKTSEETSAAHGFDGEDEAP
ncbi:MAG: trypsin-like peptidase domain-containing protein [Elusimicrobiota bacterium]